MKKAVIVLMLSVFVLAFIGTVMTTPVVAKGRVNCDKLPCVATIFPDGSKYICCEYYIVQNKCILDEDQCYWEDPIPE